MTKRLRYEISDWAQITKCLSNNSKELYITVSKYLHNPSLEGILIEVKHSALGTVFAAMPEGSGMIVTDVDKHGDCIPWMTVDEILTQLSKFGFDITYKIEKHLDGVQLSYLIMLRNLGFDKVTKIQVPDGQVTHEVVIAFTSAKATELMQFNRRVSKAKLYDYLDNMIALNLTHITQENNMNWDWLDFVAGIDDILKSNEDVKVDPHKVAKLAIFSTIDEANMHIYGEVEDVEVDDAE